MWFDSWLHQHDEAPALALLQTVVQQLQLGDMGKKLLMTAALAFGSSLLKATTLSIWDIKRIGELYEEEQFQVRDARVRLREHFQRIVDHATDRGRRRLVFFIDDLDRCTAETALTLMEALKLYLNLANCVYFLGVDKAILENSIAHKFGQQAVDEINYLEKIIQLPFTIPPISAESKEVFIGKLLPGVLSSCTELLTKGLANNPRQVKRFINVLALNHQLAVRADIPRYDVRVLAKLLLIQYWSPELYHRIVQDPSVYFALGNSTAAPDAPEVHPFLRFVLAESEEESAIPLQKYIYLTEIAGVVDVSARPAESIGQTPPSPVLTQPAAAPAPARAWSTLARLFRLGERQEQRRRTLIVGATAAAEHLIRQGKTSLEHLEFVGMVDDNPHRQGTRLQGIPVLGTTGQISEIVEARRVRLLIIAITLAPPEEMLTIVHRCVETGAEVRIVPSARELVEEEAGPDELRRLELEDVFGRDLPADLDLQLPVRAFQSKTVLITGAAGAIGSELARQLARLSPTRLILLDRAETPLSFVDLDLRQAHPSMDIVPVIADVTADDQMEHVLARYSPDCIFHSAAYKHVALLEGNLIEALRNNILGTLCVARKAADAGVTEFVLISTDKAVQPSSVMGASNRVAEQITIGWPDLLESRMNCRVVRFGNVLAAEGSVIPLFRRQLTNGQPITVTHPEVTRYFITLRVAGQLIRQAAALPELAGHVCMLEMGTPVKIVELAETLILLSGLEPYTDIPIVFTGLRPGEKLHEELLSELQDTFPTQVERIRGVRTVEPAPEDLQLGIERLTAAITGRRRDEALAVLHDLVPDCVPPLRLRT